MLDNGQDEEKVYGVVGEAEKINGDLLSDGFPTLCSVLPGVHGDPLFSYSVGSRYSRAVDLNVAAECRSC